MKKSVMKRWVRALRSGEFKQGFDALENSKGENCCLGVLCNLALIEGVCDYDGADDETDTDATFDNKSGTLPESVQEWAGIKSGDGEIPSIRKWRYLTAMNDNARFSFNQIANIIEKHYKEL